MKVEKIPVEGALLISPAIYKDARGYFYESFQIEKYRAIGIEKTFVQDNISSSSNGVLRGLHLQRTKPQGKLVSVLRGKVLDVIVDCRADSATFSKWFSVELSENNNQQLWVPPGFAHGFVSLEDNTNILYKCTGRNHNL